MRKSTAVEDILFSYPESCECGGTQTWAIRHVWYYATNSRTRYTICDCDGNHEPATKREVDKLADRSESEWLRYSRFVLETKTDPLREFMVKRKVKVRRNIVATFVSWLGASTHGMTLECVVIGKRKVFDWRSLPPQVLEFLEVDKVGDRMVAPWCTSYEAARKYCAHAGYVGQLGSREGKPGVFVKATAEWEIKRPERPIQRDLVRLAKKHIDRHAPHCPPHVYNPYPPPTP